MSSAFERVRSRRFGTTRRWLLALAALAVVVGACTSDDTSVSLPEGTSTTEGTAAPDVSAPDATAPEADAPAEAPESPPAEASNGDAEAAASDEDSEEVPAEGSSGDAEAAASDEDSDEVPVWVWVLLAALLVGVFVWLGARLGSGSSTEDQQVQPASPQQPPPYEPPPYEPPPYEPPPSQQDPPQPGA